MTMRQSYALPTANDVRPINPVLTQLSIGLKNDEDLFLWDKIAPIVEVSQRSGTYFIYTRDYWMRRMEGAERAPEGPYTRIDYGVTTANYKTNEYGFEKLLGEVTQKASLTAEDLETVDTEFLTHMIQLELEKQAAAQFFVTGNWGTSTTLAGGDQWSDYANSDPIADADTAIRTIRRNTGRVPTDLFVGILGWEKLKEHPLILDKYKHSQIGIMTEDLVANALGIKRVTVGRTVENTAAENATYVGADIWTDNALWVITDAARLGSAVGGAHLLWNEKGNNPWAIESYRDDPRRSGVTRIFTHTDPIIPSSQSGYLHLDLVA